MTPKLPTALAHLEFDPKRVAGQLSKPQAKALRWLSHGWEATQRHGYTYEINGAPYQFTTFKALEKLGLVEQFVLVPGEYPTHAYRITANGRLVAVCL